MTDERIIAYLLKELPEEELERFEDECFASEDWPPHVEIVEGELIDAYLSGALTPEQRRAFESNYLTTAARVERTRVAAALLRHLNASAAPPPANQTWGERLRAWWGARPWMLSAAAALAALVVVAGLWLLSRPQPPTRPATLATLTLNISPGRRAPGARLDTVKLTPDTDALKITLMLPDPPTPAARYRVQLEDSEQDIKHSENVMPEGRSVQVTIPPSKLPGGQYALKLFAVQPDGTERRLPGSYFFDVE